MAQENTINIGIVCGEHSGDRLGAGIIQEIKKVSKVNLYGVGGPKLAESDPESTADLVRIPGTMITLWKRYLNHWIFSFLTFFDVGSNSMI